MGSALNRMFSCSSHGYASKSTHSSSWSSSTWTCWAACSGLTMVVLGLALGPLTPKMVLKLSFQFGAYVRDHAYTHLKIISAHLSKQLGNVLVRLLRSFLMFMSFGLEAIGPLRCSQRSWQVIVAQVLLWIYLVSDLRSRIRDLPLLLINAQSTAVASVVTRHGQQTYSSTNQSQPKLKIASHRLAPQVHKRSLLTSGPHKWESVTAECWFGGQEVFKGSRDGSWEIYLEIKNVLM